MVFYPKEKGSNNMKDPVCGIDIGEKGESITHNGKEYRFCCASCRWAFEKNPVQFIEKE
jgi:YHS domain-containing protein